jgi:hypothetical protein|tara:strand:+ start:961 stop:1743 length:783 start_codon:yes stop_codon:yes gene_type:complete
MRKDNYFDRSPCNQNAIDLFEGQWFSIMPDEMGVDSKGIGKLHDDARIHWASNVFGGFQDKTVLELGPLEACHTAMMESKGAKLIRGIEGNADAYLRCLVVKELLNLKAARFELGNFVDFLREGDEVFDIGVASGVFYHMKNPVELIELLSRRVKSLFVWTHYYDAELVEAKEHVRCKFSGSWTASHKGFEHCLHAYGYGAALSWKGFCGGGSESCNWMEKPEMLRAFEYFGFEIVEEKLEADHVHGPAVWLALTNKKLA